MAVDAALGCSGSVLDVRVEIFYCPV